IIEGCCLLISEHNKPKENKNPQKEIRDFFCFSKIFPTLLTNQNTAQFARQYKTTLSHKSEKKLNYRKTEEFPNSLAEFSRVVINTVIRTCLRIISVLLRLKLTVGTLKTIPFLRYEGSLLIEFGLYDDLAEDIRAVGRGREACSSPTFRQTQSLAKLNFYCTFFSLPVYGFRLQRSSVNQQFLRCIIDDVYERNIIVLKTFAYPVVNKGAERLFSVVLQDYEKRKILYKERNDITSR
ncbi:hypothetical protein L9F63_003541, partial [Diploptera punctata]